MNERVEAAEHWDVGLRYADVLLRADALHGNRDALIFPHARLSYAKLTRRVMAVARALVAHGIGPRTRVGLLMPNCVDFIEFSFGASLVGATIVPINARFAARELGYVIGHADIDLLVTTDEIAEYTDFAAALRDALPGLADRLPRNAPEVESAPRLRTIVLVGDGEEPGMISREEFDSRAAEIDEGEVHRLHGRTRVRDAAAVLYTSGTTSMPKGCLIPHEALVRPGRGFGREKYKLGPDDRLWNPLPMFHSGSIIPMIATFDAGAAFLSMTYMEPGAAFRMIEEEGATVIYPSFPALTQALLNHPEYDPERFRNVRLALNVAPEDMLRDMQARMPHTVQLTCYGLTECGGPICISDIGDSLDERCQTSGTPLEGIEVEIRDLEGGDRRVGPDEPGEIVVRGHGVFDGYHKDPEQTAAALEPEGWFHTGDIGSIDAAGRVKYQGRLKDMLKVGGENVGALEIESRIATHPAVAMTAVVGVPDPKYMEVAAAFVELRPGMNASEEEIIEHCRAGLAKFKVPRHVRFVTEWPTSATKVQKFRLQAQLSEELATARAATAAGR